MKRRDLLWLAGCLLFYACSRFLLSPAVPGGLGLFLRCYANDIAAGAALLAWADLLLRLGSLPPLRSPLACCLLLLLAGLFWEVLTPLWRPAAVGDPWDLLAYQAGGLLWFLFQHIKKGAVQKVQIKKPSCTFVHLSKII